MVVNYAVKRLFNGAAVTVAGIILAAGPAYATIDYVGGGTWDHGFSGGYVYSDYYHGTYCHGSTAIGVYAKRSPATRKGYWSEAKAPEASFNNETYWRHEAESHCP